MFQDIANCCPTDRMPRYKGDLELIITRPFVTSEAYSKALDAKERAVSRRGREGFSRGDWLGGRHYPLERLTTRGLW